MAHQSKHKGSSSSHNSSANKKSQGSGVLGTYIYDTSSFSDRQYQGPPMTIDQQRQAMGNYLDSFDQQFGAQSGQASYQQPYYTTTRR